MHVHGNATYIGVAELCWSQEEGRGLVMEGFACHAGVGWGVAFICRKSQVTKGIKEGKFVFLDRYVLEQRGV